MALDATPTIVKSVVSGPGKGPVRHDIIEFAGETSYPTGGTTLFEAYVRDLLGLGALDVVAVIPQDCGGYLPCYDPAADTLKVYYADNNNAADGPLIEVPAATNLSAVTFNVMVISR